MSDIMGDGSSDARTSSGRSFCAFGNGSTYGKDEDVALTKQIEAMKRRNTADAILRDMPQSIVTKLLALMYADSQLPVSHEWHAWLKRRSDYLGIVTADSVDA